MPESLRTVRSATPEDRSFLTEMLIEAMTWSPERNYSRDQFLMNPKAVHYAAEWPRTGEIGVIAEASRRPVGAVWLRPAAGPDLLLASVDGDRGRGLRRRVAGPRRGGLRGAARLPAGAGRNELLLRDYLRTHPAEAQRYVDLKRDLAVRYEASADYTRAKTELIQELTDRARAARGLPSVPVWEERAKPASPGLCPSFVGSATSIVSAT